MSGEGRGMSLQEKLGPILTGLLPTAPIVISLAGHFILANFAMLGTMVQTVDYEAENLNGIWLPLTYIFYNVVFFQLGIWTLQQRDRILPVVVFILAVAFTAVSDIIMLGTNYANSIKFVDTFDNGFEHIWMFSSVMMILNLVGKPFTIALACVSIFFRVRAASSSDGGDDGAYQSLPGNSGN